MQYLAKKIGRKDTPYLKARGLHAAYHYFDHAVSTIKICQGFTNHGTYSGSIVCSSTPISG